VDGEANDAGCARGGRGSAAQALRICKQTEQRRPSESVSAGICMRTARATLMLRTRLVTSKPMRDMDAPNHQFAQVSSDYAGSIPAHLAANRYAHERQSSITDVTLFRNLWNFGNFKTGGISLRVLLADLTNYEENRKYGSINSYYVNWIEEKYPIYFYCIF
jgi:hypothetical protein